MGRTTPLQPDEPELGGELGLVTLPPVPLPPNAVEFDEPPVPTPEPPVPTPVPPVAEPPVAEPPVALLLLLFVLLLLLLEVALLVLLTCWLLLWFTLTVDGPPLLLLLLFVEVLPLPIPMLIGELLPAVWAQVLLTWPLQFWICVMVVEVDWLIVF